MPDLKPITHEGIPAALDKAQRYRLLNDSAAAESICEDILLADPGNDEARVLLVLALTDQFLDGGADRLARARDSVERFEDPYARAYYHGIIAERWAKAVLRRGTPGAAELAYEWIERAMQFYQKAERIRPAGEDDAILRWNACVRLLNADPRLKAGEAEAYEPSLE
jgi:hypothetical protein